MHALFFVSGVWGCEVGGGFFLEFFSCCRNGKVVDGEVGHSMSGFLRKKCRDREIFSEKNVSRLEVCELPGYCKV